MAENITKLENLINPQVLGDMISAKVEAKLNAIPYATVDNTLKGQAGDTITIPKYGYIGDAVEVGEGEEIPTRALSVTTEQHTVKKIGIGGTLTDEALLSGYGDPQGELANQIPMSISSKINKDTLDELYKAKTIYSGTNVLSYKELVNGIDLFNEEINSQKVMWVNPKQVTQLRLDPDFIDKNKYEGGVMVSGEIGRICNTTIVPSRLVKLIKYAKDETGTITIVADSTEESATALHLDTVMKNFVGELAIGDKVKALSTNLWACPIVKLNEDTETEKPNQALTYFIKRDTNIETDRIKKRRLTEVTGDQMYVVALTDETKVVLAKFTETVPTV